jgi:hypothetical protein
MPGGNVKPYRRPCGSTSSAQYFFGSPFQHGLSASHIPKFANTTTVPNYNTIAGGTIPPYERFLHEQNPCTGEYICTDGDNLPPCGRWPLPVTANVFTDTGDYVDMTVTRKRGFKNVFAKRCWSGRFGFNDTEGSDGPDLALVCGSGASMKAYRTYKATPKRTRYARLAIAASWSETSSGVTTDQTAAVQQTISATTGIRNVDSLSLSPNSELNDAFAQLAKGFWAWSEICDFFFTPFTSAVDSDTTTYSADGFVKTLEPPDGRTRELVTWDLAGGTFDRKVYGTPFGGVDFELLWEETVTVSDASFEYVYNAYNAAHSRYLFNGDTLTVTVTGTLSEAISDADIYADIVTLLAYWDLTDDEEYPFRTDNKTGLGPLMTRDELLTTDFDSTGFYLRDYDAPVTDPLGHTLGDPDWGGDTGYTVNPNPDTGTYRTAVDFPGYNSGSVIDLQVTPGFGYTDAAVTYSVIGGEFPPGVSMDGSGHITGTMGDDGHYGVTIEATCGVAAATGEVIGAPLPAGHQNFFDFRFRDLRACCFHNEETGSVTFEWFEYGSGGKVSQFNTDYGCQIPLNATHWTNRYEGMNKPTGAFLMYADPDSYYPNSCIPSNLAPGLYRGDGNFWSCKYAEILDPWYSQNFARPAGDDKFLWDETRVVCATNVSGTGEGSVWALTDPITGLPPAAGPEPDDFWGGPSIGGFYFIAGWDGTNVTLGAKHYDVPSNFRSRSNSDEDVAFGPLRWAGKPSLLGRAAITPNADLSCTFATAQPAFGMDARVATAGQEQIDIYNPDMALIVANTTATRSDNSTFTVDTFYPDAAFVQIHGTPAYYFNDNLTKGDLLLLQWEADNRSAGEHTRLQAVNDCDGSTPIGGGPSTNAGGGPVTLPYKSFTQTEVCIQFGPCAPKVICISPNGEIFPNGNTYPFPDEFIADETYGSKWWAYVQSTMTDLLWQQPHRPCNIEPCARWLQDDGTCQQPVGGACPDDPPLYYFEDYPLVEARATIPTNYGQNQDETTTLADGLQIGWLSPVIHTTADGAVAFPPLPSGPQENGIPGNAIVPWVIHDLYCASTANGCLFNYSTPGCA